MLTISENSPLRLVAQQVPVNMAWLYILLSVGFAVVAGAAFYNRRWVLGGLFLASTAAFAYGLTPATTYSIEVDKQAQTVAWEARRSGTVEAQGSLPTASIQSADFDFNRNARNILLIGRDGKQYFPLGNQHFEGEPEQSVVLAAIRELIGQNGDNTPAPQTAR